ncbi:MAG TPA: triple tyrosine motif-containing protein, partial [Flavisolibacter sp.]
SAGCVNIINTKTGKVRFITDQDGLPSNTTMSVEKDRNGIVWVGMMNGICRLNVEKNLITYYDRRDGIIYDKFTLAGVKELSDGRLIYFTPHNFLVFDPMRFRQEVAPPRSWITGFRVGNTSHSVDSLMQAGRAVLRYNNSSFAVNFSAMTYLPQQKVHYYYMLEGLDDDWIRTDRPIEAIYNYLPPGEYTFKVKSENADGRPSPVIASLPVFVRPPFWKTWWFYSLIILDVILVLYLIDRERMKKLRSMQQLRTSIAGNLHQEINTTLNNINVLSEIAKIKADRNVEQSKEFIDQISDKSRYMIESMDDMLWSIHPENDSMKKTLARIKEVTEGMQADYDADIDLIVDNRLQSLQLDMKIRHELYFYYKEAMSFILQHSQCNQKFVNINLVRSRLMLEILSECGKGEMNFEEQFRNVVQKRVEAMNGTIEVTSDPKSFVAVLTVNIRAAQ